ncbi:GNAT family acetyltransferase [Marinomonas sp. 2405UD68-3]|uniref:GNAT family acetyltransferase n=1 Tax=Marinomonas sp. 2405UD68-3 TaxID=3391835 RepID=UPI0039C960A7
MKIRVFTEKDRLGVVALWEECGLVKPQNNPNKDIDRKLSVDPDLFLVGIDQGELVATVMGGYEGHRGWINYLAVKPDAQKRSYGRQIMEEVEWLIKLRKVRISLLRLSLSEKPSNKARFCGNVNTFQRVVTKYGVFSERPAGHGLKARILC